MLKWVSWIGYWILQAETPLWALGTFSFFLKNSPGFAIWKAAVFCHHMDLVEGACFSASLNCLYHKWPKHGVEQIGPNGFADVWAGGNEVTYS